MQILFCGTGPARDTCPKRAFASRFSPRADDEHALSDLLFSHVAEYVFALSHVRNSGVALNMSDQCVIYS